MNKKLLLVAGTAWLGVAASEPAAHAQRINFTKKIMTKRPRYPTLAGLLAIILAYSLSPVLAQAQFSQQGPKLVASDAIGNAWQGSSVSLSADGNTAIVGGYQDNNGIGAEWVYTRSGGMWSQQAKLIATDSVGNAAQGFSSSLSADGNTAIVAGYFDNNGAGAVWVYTRSGGVWSQQTKLIGTGAIGPLVTS